MGYCNSGKCLLTAIIKDGVDVKALVPYDDPKNAFDIHKWREIMFPKNPLCIQCFLEGDMLDLFHNGAVERN